MKLWLTTMLGTDEITEIRSTDLQYRRKIKPTEDGDAILAALLNSGHQMATLQERGQATELMMTTDPQWIGAKVMSFTIT